MTIVVEKSIQHPGGVRRGWGRYPWETMEVGDSFLVPEDVAIDSARSGATIAGRKHNRKFSIRKTDNGYRCWRIA